jgi:hypothetical protein
LYIYLFALLLQVKFLAEGQRAMQEGRRPNHQ